MISKTAILSAGASLSVFAISNEFYVVNEESIIMLATLSVFWAVFHYGGPMYKDWAEGQIAKMKGILNAAREDHTSAVKTRIDHVKELTSVIDVTKQLFEVSKVPLDAFTGATRLKLTCPRKRQRLRPRFSSWSKRRHSLLKLNRCLTRGCVMKAKSSKDNRRSLRRT